jgi:alcohol dehydrogenase class IV
MTVEPFTFFHSARRVVFAWDGIAQLKDIAAEHGARRVAVVVDGFFMTHPLRDRLSALLTPVAIHGVPQHEPDVAVVEACRDALAAADADMIVALGGGSAMDAAKVARMALANPGPVEGFAGLGKTLAPHRSLLVCVPTTAGTGSEVSESAIVSRTDSDVKLIYRSPEMTARIALLDPALSVSAPTSVTAQSGYDAVTHAVEAYVSRAASLMSDPFAESALAMLAHFLPIAWAEPEHREARARCLIASCQAAIAFNSANLGLAHAISAPLGALHHVPHGLGNALALPAVTAFNEPLLGEKGRMIAELLGGASAADGLSKLRHAIGLDLGLDDYVPDDAARDRLAQAAMRSGQVRMNPRLADLAQMRAILEAARQPDGGARPELPL